MRAEVGMRETSALLWILLAATASFCQNAIQDRITAFLNAKAAQVVIPPGTYRVGTGLRFSNVKDFKVIADGVAMICTHTGSSLEMDKCENVEIAGLSVDYDPLPFTQGTIVAAAADWSTIDVKIHAGYRTDQPIGTRMEVYDKATRLLKKDVWMISDQPISQVSPGVYRYSGTGSFRNKVSLGDYVVDAYNGSMSIQIFSCANVTLRNFTHYCSYSYGVIESYSRADRFINYRLMLGPLPAGASEPRLRTANYDGMHFINDRIGPYIENGLIENNGDDGIAIHGVFGKVSAGLSAGTKANIYSVSGGDGDFGAEAGDTLIFMNPDFSYNGMAPVRSSNGNDYTLDRPVTVAAAGLVYNANRIGSGYVIPRERHSQQAGARDPGAGQQRPDREQPHRLDPAGQPGPVP